MKNLSVVIPAYNEEDNIKGAVLDVLEYFGVRQKILQEVIVVNDGSTDKTLSILLDLQKRHSALKIIGTPNRGHGRAVMTGLKEAQGDWILYIDADRQIDVENYRVHPGKLFYSGYRVHRQDKFFRKVVSFCLKMTNLFRHGYYIKDANCPFKIYNRVRLSYLLEKVPTTEVIPIACLEVLARKAGIEIEQIPVTHHKYRDTFGERKGFLQELNKKTISFFWRAFKEIWTI